MRGENVINNKFSKIKIDIVNDSNHPLPKYQSEGASGLDLRANLKQPVTLDPMERTLVPTGIYIAMPRGIEAQIRARSGLAIKKGISLINGIGTIDSDYRGEIKVAMVNLSNESFTIEDGERIAQIVFMKYESVEWQEVGELDKTERGAGGFNSTGMR